MDYEALYRDHADAEVLINATPVGMYPGNGASPVDVACLPALEGVIDVIYNPDRTPLVLAAQKRGLPAAGGLWMLVMQAVLAAEKFLGKRVDTERAADIYATLRMERLNLVLIGMPGSGKTTLGRALAEALHRPFVDCDAEIERAAGMPIPEISAQRARRPSAPSKAGSSPASAGSLDRLLPPAAARPCAKKTPSPCGRTAWCCSPSALWRGWPPMAGPCLPAVWRRCAAWK